METKSRYEVVADLEAQKRDLIREKAGFDDEIKDLEKAIKESKRTLEDKEEELKNFKDGLKDKKIMIDSLIKTVDAGLINFSKIHSQKK